MKINVELGNQEVRDMLVARLRTLMPEVEFDEKDVRILVKSKQNYRVHEWEDGEIMVAYVHRDE